MLPRIKFTLQFRFFGLLLIGGGLLAGALIWLGANWLESLVRDELSERADLLATTISESAHVIDDYEQMRYALDEIALKTSGVYGITLATRDPLIIWASSFHSSSDTDRYTENMLSMVELAAKNNVFGHFVHANGDLIVTRPISVLHLDKQGNAVSDALPPGLQLPAAVRVDSSYALKPEDYEGILFLRFDWQGTRKQLDRLLVWDVLISSVAILLMMLLSWGVLNRLVVSRIQQIANVAVKQRAGDRNARVNATQDDELANLAKLFDGMLDVQHQRDRLLHSLIDHLPMALSLRDRKGGDEISNRRFRAWFSAAGGVQDFDAFLRQRSKQETQVLDMGGELTHEERLVSSQGKERHYLTTFFPVLDEAGEVEWLAAISADITERKADEMRMRQLYRAVEAVRSGILIVDALNPDLPIVYANPAMQTVTGYSSQELIGRNPRFMFGEEVDQPGVVQIRSAIDQYQDCKTIVRNYRKDGSAFWNEFTLTVMRDADDKPTHFIGIISDVSERVAAEAHIERLAFFDSLTGLPNRTLFNDRLQQLLLQAGRSGLQLAVLWVDLDGFKAVNDTYGHAAGDHLLEHAGKRLAQCVRAQDTVARMGGDEFAAIIDRLKPAEAAQIAAKIASEMNKALMREFNEENAELFVSASIGISLYPLDGQSAEQLLQNADSAMYHAKSMGKNNAQFFKQVMNTKIRRRRVIETALRSALAEAELSLHYQPQVAVDGQAPLGVEALLRWRSAELGEVQPEEFIDVAESCGLINDIGEWVIQRACADFRAWKDSGVELGFVAVNLSLHQFRLGQLPEIVEAALVANGLPGNVLEVEVTESTMMEDFALVKEDLQRIRDLGVKVAIDDFGTGYSPLTYLRNLPADLVKIDKSFVAGVTDNAGDRAIVEAIFGMAGAMRLQVVGEGVEDEEQWAYLAGLQCDRIQGLYISGALPADGLLAYLKRQDLSQA